MSHAKHDRQAQYHVHSTLCTLYWVYQSATSLHLTNVLTSLTHVGSFFRTARPVTLSCVSICQNRPFGASSVVFCFFRTCFNAVLNWILTYPSFYPPLELPFALPMPRHLVFSTVIDRCMLIGLVYIESWVVMTIRALASYVSMRVSLYRNHGHRYGHVFTNLAPSNCAQH